MYKSSCTLDEFQNLYLKCVFIREAYGQDGGIVDLRRSRSALERVLVRIAFETVEESYNRMFGPESCWAGFVGDE